MAFAKPPVRSSEDFRRVQAIPVRGEDFYPPNLVEKLTAILRTPTGSQVLFDVQARALYDAAKSGKGFYPIKVGGGKTLISFLLPVVLKSQRPLLVVPAAMVEETTRKWREAMKDWQVAKHLVIKSYEWISRVSGATYLEFYKPDLIMTDEAFKIKNPKAAVTRRFRRFMEGHQSTRFIPMAGTLSKSGVEDFAHLMGWALRETSCLPHLTTELKAWAGALDEGLNPAARRSAGVLLDLFPEPPGSEPPPPSTGYLDDMLTEADNHTENEARRARRIFCARMNATVGVVSADSKNDYTGSILIEGLEYQPNEATEANFKMLREQMCKPDGWALADAMQVWAEARRLILGLHYTWFDYGRFVTCLGQILKNDVSTLGITAPHIARISSNIVRRIVIESASRRDCVTGMVSAINRLNNNVRNTFNEHTESLSKNTTGYLINLAGSATSAGKDLTEKNVSTWITIIEQEGLGACFARLAIGRSAFWETLLKALPELLSIFNVAVAYAGAPEEWLNARKLWAKFVRDTLADPRSMAKGLDSELQVTTAVRSGDLEDPFDLLASWQAIRPSFEVNPVAVWHDDTALRVCTEWMKTHERGIVWVEHTQFGAELARRTGLSYFGPKGLDSKEQFIQDASGPIIASIAANSTGRNLQHKWDCNLVTAPAADSERNEQLIARTHRPGQKADTVTVDILVACREQLESIPRAIASAKVKRDLLGATPKLLLADVNWPDVRGGVGPRWT